MKRLTIMLGVLTLVGISAQSAWAEPAWGVNCLSCHSQLQSGLIEVFGEDTLADPDESATGAPDRGLLKTFQALPTTTETLQAEVLGLSADDTYAVQLKRLRYSGVESGARLEFNEDCSWPGWGEPATYYTEPPIGYYWGEGPTAFAFDIQVEPTLPFHYDYYDLVFAVAGKYASDGSLFYSEEHFYLYVGVYKGDFDEDGDVDLTDYMLFADCLTGPEEGIPRSECTIFDQADFDEDGYVDLDDFAAFQEAFTGS